MSVKITRFKNEYRLEAEQTIARDLSEVFSYFSEAKNLERLTPDFLRFKIASNVPIEMYKGATIDYNLRLHGLPIRWTSLISEWEPPWLFVDEQIKGPYRYWIHQHRFEAQGSETLVKDFVRYQAFGGRVVHDHFIKRDLERIFSYRQQQLAKNFS